VADPRAVWVLGLGPLQELGEMNEILDRMWRAQVWPHVGRPVRVSLRDAQGSSAGMLAQVTPHSLVLEADGRQETIDFTQISGIEPVRATPANP
jgi:hypothetical protein